MGAHKLPQLSAIAAFVTHSRAHELRFVGTLVAAELVTDPCALIATTATAITTSSLENMANFFF